MVPKVSVDHSNGKRRVSSAWPMIWSEFIQNKLSSTGKPSKSKLKSNAVDVDVDLEEAQKLSFEEEQNLEAAFHSASIALEATSEDDEEKQMMVPPEHALDVQAMSTMEVIELIQTNPELGDIINDFIKQKQALEARDSQHSSTKMQLTKSNDSKGSKPSTSNLSAAYTSSSSKHSVDSEGKKRRKRHSKTPSVSSSAVLKSFAHRF